MTPEPQNLDAPMTACADGALAPNVALASLVARAPTPAAVESAIVDAQRRHAGSREASQRLGRAAALWRETPNLWNDAKAILDRVGHVPDRAAPEQWAMLFDEAARISPEVGVALYSLGRGDLLEAATRSIIAKLDEWALLGPERRALDLGCGAGRLTAALAPHLATVTGTDVSAGMLHIARERCARFGNASFIPANGRNLAALADESFELIVAVDVFPYLVASEDALAGGHFAECRRVLVPNGALLVLNYSYRGDYWADVDEVRAHASRHGLSLVRIARGDFALWDGETFHLHRSS